MCQESLEGRNDYFYSGGSVDLFKLRLSRKRIPDDVTGEFLHSAHLEHAQLQIHVSH